MRTNVLLRCHRHYKSFISRPIRRRRARAMNLRGILRRQRNPYPILCLPLPIPICHCRSYDPSPSFPPRNRVKQPRGTKLRCRQDFVPPLLLVQRLIRVRRYASGTHISCSFLPESTRRPRQFHTCQSTSYPSSHQA